MSVFTGCIPALMTPCNADRTPNFDLLVKKGKELIAAGMSAVVYCGSMGDWPLLTDEERQEGVRRLCEAGVPVIVGTGAINTRSAVSHAAHAAKVGAKGLMVIPRVLSRGSSVSAQRNHFSAILEAAKEEQADTDRELQKVLDLKQSISFMDKDALKLFAQTNYGQKLDGRLSVEALREQANQMIDQFGVV